MSNGNWIRRIFCTQRLPSTPPTAEVPDPPPSVKDRNFALYGRLTGSWKVPQPNPISMRGPWLERDVPHAWLESSGPQSFRLDVMVMTPQDHADNTTRVRDDVQRLAAKPASGIHQQSATHWQEFWSKSAVELDDPELEKIWYHNQYFLACCLRQGKVAPGQAGNWITPSVGSSWHGDYHFDYNVEQVYWGVFSSNHADQHYPYIDLVEHLLPAAEARAKETRSPRRQLPAVGLSCSQHRQRGSIRPLVLSDLRYSLGRAESLVALPLHHGRECSATRLSGAASSRAIYRSVRKKRRRREIPHRTDGRTRKFWSHRGLLAQSGLHR